MNWTAEFARHSKAKKANKKKEKENIGKNVEENKDRKKENKDKNREENKDRKKENKDKNREDKVSRKLSKAIAIAVQTEGKYVFFKDFFSIVLILQYVLFSM